MKNLFGAAALVASLAVPIAAHAALTQLTDLFVFGDSLSDGGNSGLATQQYTGDPAVVFPPPPYDGGRYSNGQVAVEYLWKSFNPGDTSFKPSLAGGTNYAIGGATTGLENFNLVNDAQVPAALQPAFAQKGNTWQLQTFAGQSPSFNPATSLFVVWLFPNDVFYQGTTGNLPGTYLGGLPTVGNPPPPDPTALIGNGIGNIVGTIGALAQSGAQHFLVPNMGDLGGTPEFFPNPGLSLLTAAFNQNLKAALTQLDQALPTVDIVQFDTAKFLKSVEANAKAYGLENTTDSCLDNPTTCNPDTWAFWDGVHPTTKLHSIVGEGFRAAVVPEPQTYALMALGLAAVGWAARRRKPVA